MIFLVNNIVNPVTEQEIKTYYDVSKYLSTNYISDSEDIAGSCLHNAQVAAKMNRQDIEDIWNYLRYVFKFSHEQNETDN